MSYLLWLFLIVINLSPSSCFTRNITFKFTSDTPANCSDGLTYSGVLLTMEYRSNLHQWNFLKKIVMNVTDRSYIESTISVMIPYSSGTDLVQLGVVQYEHGGGECNCWGISTTVFILGIPAVNFFKIVPPSSGVSSSDNMTLLCGQAASSPRRIVFSPFNPSIPFSEVSQDSLDIDPPPTDVQDVLYSMNCTANEKVELMYEINITTDDVISFKEGVEVSIGNWDNDGKWIPLVYHNRNSNSIVSHDIRGYTVPVHVESGAYNVTICQQSDAVGKIATLDAIRLYLVKNGTRTSFSPESLYSYALRNAMVSPSCPGSVILGNNCTTFGCRQCNNQISRLATITPSYNGDFLSPSNITIQSESTYSSIQYIGPSKQACNVTPTLPQEPSLLSLVLINVTSTIKDSELLSSIKNEPPTTAITNLTNFVMDEPAAVIVYLVADILNRFNGTNYGILYETTLIIANMLINQQSMSITRKPSVIVGSSLLAAVEKLVLYDVLYPVQTLSKTENIVTVILEVNQNTKETYFTSINVGDNSILVPFELVNTVTGGKKSITVLSVYYRNMSGLLPGTLPGQMNTILASPVVSTSLLCGRNICDTTNVTLNQPIIVTLRHSLVVQSLDENTIGICVFWEFISSKNDNRLLSGNWKTDGCTRNSNLSNSTHTVCECTHLTNFAILLSPKPISADPENTLALKWIGFIGVTLSVIAMLCTVLALGCLRSLWNMRRFVHINLCISLILAQLTFMIGVNQHGGGNTVLPSCQAAAVLIHYLFLVSFMWMLMEGIVLYIFLVKVFDNYKKRYLAAFMVSSYGAPLLYMALCVPLSYFPFHGENHGYGYATNTTSDNNTTKVTVVCWLNDSSNFILAFIVPVVLIILINIGFFIMTIKIIRKHAKQQSHKNLIQKARHWLKSSVSLATVMGITWIVGVLVIQVHALLPLSYIFTVFVAFQGVAIFVNFVLIPKQVREGYQKWWQSKVAESDALSRLFGNIHFEGKVHHQGKSTPAVKEQKKNPDSKKTSLHLTTIIHNRSVAAETANKEFMYLQSNSC